MTGPPAVVLYLRTYAPGRGAAHAAATLLAGYCGIVQCDGYAAYKQLARRGRAGNAVVRPPSARGAAITTLPKIWVDRRSWRPALGQLTFGENQALPGMGGGNSRAGARFGAVGLSRVR